MYPAAPGSRQRSLRGVSSVHGPFAPFWRDECASNPQLRGRRIESKRESPTARGLPGEFAIFPICRVAGAWAGFLQTQETEANERILPDSRHGCVPRRPRHRQDGWPDAIDTQIVCRGNDRKWPAAPSHAFARAPRRRRSAKLQHVGIFRRCLSKTMMQRAVEKNAQSGVGIRPVPAESLAASDIDSLPSPAPLSGLRDRHPSRRGTMECGSW